MIVKKPTRSNNPAAASPGSCSSRPRCWLVGVVESSAALMLMLVLVAMLCSLLVAADGGVSSTNIVVPHRMKICNPSADGTTTTARSTTTSEEEHHHESATMKIEFVVSIINSFEWSNGREAIELLGQDNDSTSLLVRNLISEELSSELGIQLVCEELRSKAATTTTSSGKNKKEQDRTITSSTSINKNDDGDFSFVSHYYQRQHESSHHQHHAVQEDNPGDEDDEEDYHFSSSSSYFYNHNIKEISMALLSQDEVYDYVLFTTDLAFCGTLCGGSSSHAWYQQHQDHQQGTTRRTASADAASTGGGEEETKNNNHQQQPRQHDSTTLLVGDQGHQLISMVNTRLQSQKARVHSIDILYEGDNVARRLQQNATTTLLNCTSSNTTTTSSDGAAATKFSATFVMLFDTGGDELLVEDDNYQAIGGLFQSSYEAANTLNPSLCDPHGRIISGTKVFGQGSPESEIYNLDPSDSNVVAFGITVVGSCDQCQENDSGEEFPPPLFQRSVDDDLLGSTAPALCTTCPPNITQRLPTEEEFGVIFGAALVEAEILLEASKLLAIIPQITVGCSGADKIPFTFRLPVGLEGLSGCTAPLTQDDQDELARAFVRSYNRLVSELYCDPYFRSLDAAFVVDQDASISVGGNLTIELEVSGALRCPDGTASCNVDMIGLFHDTSNLNHSATVIGNRRRTLQEGVCGCPAGALVERGPTEPELLVEFQAQVQLILNALECQGLQVSQCEDSGMIFNSALRLTFANASAAREKSEVEIGEAALATLKEIFAVGGNSTTFCNPEFRVFGIIRFVFLESRRSLEKTSPDNSRSLQDTMVPSPATTEPPIPSFSQSATTASMQPTSESPSSLFLVPEVTLTGDLLISGSCKGCTSELFATNQIDSRLLSENVLETASLRQGASPTPQSSCVCPIGSEVIDPQPGIVSFETRLEQLLDLEIAEVVTIEIQGAEFSYRVVVELQNLSTCSLPLSEADQSLLAGAFQQAYNRLVSESYCDPYSRRLDAAFVVDQSPSTADDGSITVELQVSGTLQCLNGTEGCDVDEIGLYSNPSQSAVVNRRRQLQETMIMLGCPPNAIADRGPTEPEVLVEFQAQVQSILTGLDCQSLQVAQCEGSGTVFLSALQMTFADASAALQTSELAIAAAATAALADIFSLDNNSSACNPEFRVFDNVRFVFVDQRRTLERTRDDQLAFHRRHLQDPSTLAPSPATTKPEIPTTSGPTFAPTSSTSPTTSFRPVIESQRPSIGTGFALIGNLIISGSCNGCSDEMFASDQVDGRLLERLPDFSFFRQSSPRDLQVVSPPLSNCFCPIGSDLIDSRPNIARFEAALEERSGLEIAETIEIDAEELTPLVGNYSFDCTDVKNSFRKNITLELQYKCAGEIPNLSPDEKDALASVYVSSYNSLRAGVCDPFSLAISSAQVVNVGDLRVDGTSLPIIIEVVADCYGCDPLSADIYGFAEDGAVLRDEPKEISRWRRVLQTGVCECPETLPRRAPLEADVTTMMNPTLLSLGLTCFGNITECNFGASFGTNIMLDVQFGAQDPLVGASNLQTAYRNAVNGVVNGSNSTQCNPLFGNVTDSEIFLEFVYNSVPIVSTAIGVPASSRELYRSVFPKTATHTKLRRLQAEIGNQTLDLDAVLENVTSEVPSSAPTSLFQDASTLVLLQASGVCNGCPADLFFGDEISSRRGLDRLGEFLPSDTFESKDDFRNLVELSGDEVESNCYCPIGSIIVQPDFDTVSFLESFVRELAKLDNETTIIADSALFGVRQVTCAEETTFTSELIFDFSAFEWVLGSLSDVQGLGDEVAAIYNSLVTDACDEYFRHSITLTLDTTSIVRVNPTLTRRDEELGKRRLQQGCFNYQARFIVSGRCRGCSTLGNPIPVFGPSITDSRDLEEEVLTMARDRWQRRHESAAAASSRNLEDGMSTCVCDSTSIGRQSAPSLLDVQEQLALLIPSTLPWLAYPSICGLPVAKEEPCPVLPVSDFVVVLKTFYANRPDGGCLVSTDLDEIAQAYMDFFNEQKQLTRFTCEPSYLQISSIVADYSLLPDCGRRNMLRHESRALARDSIPVPLTMIVWGGVWAAGNMLRTVVDDASSFDAAGKGVEVRTAGKYGILFDASSSPSMFPSGFPSEFPSAFPSEFPSANPTQRPSSAPSVGSCTSTAQSCTGDVITVQLWCDSLAGSDACCLDDDTYSYVPCQWAGQATIFRGSCNGSAACWFPSTATSITVGPNSCNGNYACDEIGYSDCGGTDSATSIDIGSDSCNGLLSCNSIASWEGDTITIGDNSCNEYRACYEIGVENQQGQGNTVSIGDNSCLGQDACRSIGEFGSSTISIGAGSCLGYQACNSLGNEQALSITIGDNSCTYDESCELIGDSADNVVISKKSCDKKCIDLCGCAYFFNPGDVTCSGCECSGTA